MGAHAFAPALLSCAADETEAQRARILGEFSSDEKGEKKQELIKMRQSLEHKSSKGSKISVPMLDKVSCNVSVCLL